MTRPSPDFTVSVRSERIPGGARLTMHCPPGQRPPIDSNKGVSMFSEMDQRTVKALIVDLARDAGLDVQVR